MDACDQGSHRSEETYRMTINAAALAALRADVRGRVIAPGDPDYDEARRVWNAAIDKRPSAIVYCSDANDVVEAVTFARATNGPVAVRSGGHNVAGLSVCDDGIVIDLSRMKAIEVDPVRRVARAGAGLSLGEFDAATQAHGLATTMGVNSDTGIAGLTLGGGFGKLGRKYGLTCDNLIAADIVTADARLLHVSAAEHPDLYWGLRGGGGNFGIVTAFEYRLHRVGPTLLVGSVLHRYEHARGAIKFYHEFASRAADDLSVDAALVTLPTGERTFSISACHFGRPEAGEDALAPLMKFGSPIDASLAPRSYLDVQSAGEIDAMLEIFPKAPSTAALLVFQQVGGAIARVPAWESPYANRDALYDCFPLARWDDRADDERNVRWARELWSALRPYSTGGVYANNLGDEGEDRVRAAYGENHARLVELKNRYDPTNFFRLNQNIRPTN
jgi:FAD/FMN-containing dehydrogenase